MSLTSAEKTNIVFLLGWPAKTLIVGSTHYDQTVVTRLNALDADIEAIVRTMLTGIEDVRTKYATSTSRMLVKKVGDIELNTDEHSTLGGEYKRLLRELSSCLDIPFIGKSRTNLGVRC